MWPISGRRPAQGDKHSSDQTVHDARNADHWTQEGNDIDASMEVAGESLAKEVGCISKEEPVRVLVGSAEIHNQVPPDRLDDLLIREFPARRTGARQKMGDLKTRLWNSQSRKAQRDICAPGMSILFHEN